MQLKVYVLLVLWWYYPFNKPEASLIVPDFKILAVHEIIFLLFFYYFYYYFSLILAPFPSLSILWHPKGRMECLKKYIEKEKKSESF